MRTLVLLGVMCLNKGFDLICKMQVQLKIFFLLQYYTTLTQTSKLKIGEQSGCSSCFLGSFITENDSDVKYI